MGFFGFLRGPDINRGVEEFRATPGALLIDVRTAGEYKRGSIPGSMNIPLDSFEDVFKIVSDKGTPIFLHCQSGARSRQAEVQLLVEGYTRVKNIGGISSYKGELRR